MLGIIESPPYHMEVFYHHGAKSFGIEVIHVEKGKQIEYETGFPTADDARAYLGKYNTVRFILED